MGYSVEDHGGPTYIVGGANVGVENLRGQQGAPHACVEGQDGASC